MTKLKDPVLERNEKMTTPADFLEAYNKGLPPHYPQATLADLVQFQTSHTRLFNEKGEWSIVKHRKRFMDYWNSASRRQQ